MMPVRVRTHTHRRTMKIQIRCTLWTSDLIPVNIHLKQHPVIPSRPHLLHLYLVSSHPSFLFLLSFDCFLPPFSLPCSVPSTLFFFSLLAATLRTHKDTNITIFFFPFLLHKSHHHSHLHNNLHLFFCLDGIHSMVPA